MGRGRATAPGPARWLCEYARQLRCGCSAACTSIRHEHQPGPACSPKVKPCTHFAPRSKPGICPVPWRCSPRMSSSTGFEPDGAEASIMTIEHELLPPALVRRDAHGWTAISAQLESRLRSTESRSPDPGSRTRTPTAPHWLVTPAFACPDPSRSRSVTFGPVSGSRCVRTGGGRDRKPSWKSALRGRSR